MTSNIPSQSVIVDDIHEHMTYVNKHMNSRFAPLWNEDLQGDTVVRCVAKFHQFRGESSNQLRCWMTSIARRILFTTRRGAKRRGTGCATLSMDDLVEGHCEPSYATDPVRLLDLRRAISRLRAERPNHYNSLVKYRLNGQSLGRNSESTRVYRAVLYLREYMGVTKRTIP